MTLPLSGQHLLTRQLATKPAAPTADMVSRVAQYRSGPTTFDVSEHGGTLWIAMNGLPPEPLVGRGPAFTMRDGRTVIFGPLAMRIDGASVPRRDIGAERVAAFQASLAASPERGTGDIPVPAWVDTSCGDLVTIDAVDRRIKVELAYATADNFMGRPVYPVAIAALRQPVAEALSRVQSALQAMGYALLVYDAYRPWSITRLFWELVPEESRAFVADPAVGSNHNRGCAVDVTLWDLAGGRPVAMPGRFDEATPRSAADYDGGTSLERWHRDLLRLAMAAEDFTVHPGEWWHFDHASCAGSPILDIALSDVASRCGVVASTSL